VILAAIGPRTITPLVVVALIVTLIVVLSIRRRR
jgi:hypothetical protein